MRGEDRLVLTAAFGSASRRRRTAAGWAFIPASACMRYSTGPREWYHCIPRGLDGRRGIGLLESYKRSGGSIPRSWSRDLPISPHLYASELYASRQTNHTFNVNFTKMTDKSVWDKEIPVLKRMIQYIDQGVLDSKTQSASLRPNSKICQPSAQNSRPGPLSMESRKAAPRTGPGPPK